MLQIYGAFVYFGALAIFAVCGMLFSVVGVLLSWALPAKVGGRIGRRMVSWLFRTYVGFLRLTGLVKVESSGLEGMKKAGGVLIAPNHPCLIDAVFIIARFPDVVCIMKAGILRNPVLAGGSRFAGYISNAPSLAMVKKSVEALRSGCKLLVFPEGTRTVEPPVNRFQRSFAIIGRASESPVQVVFVESNSPCFGKGWPIFKVPRFPLRYRIRLGDEVRVPRGGDLRGWVSDLEGEFREELAGKVEVPGHKGD